MTLTPEQKPLLMRGSEGPGYTQAAAEPPVGFQALATSPCGNSRIRAPTSSPRNGFAVVAGGARLCKRLEGCPRVPALRPSFETLASQAPQDEVGDIFTTSFAGR